MVTGGLARDGANHGRWRTPNGGWPVRPQHPRDEPATTACEPRDSPGVAGRPLSERRHWARIRRSGAPNREAERSEVIRAAAEPALLMPRILEYRAPRPHRTGSGRCDRRERLTLLERAEAVRAQRAVNERGAGLLASPGPVPVPFQGERGIGIWIRRSPNDQRGLAIGNRCVPCATGPLIPGHSYPTTAAALTSASRWCTTHPPFRRSSRGSRGR